MSARWSFELFRDHAYRGETLVMARKAMREGWGLTPEDRDALRDALGELVGSKTLTARQSGVAREILAELEAPSA